MRLVRRLLVIVVVDQDPVELVDSLLRIGLLIMIQLDCRCKPLPRLGILARLEQRISVGISQPS